MCNLMVSMPYDRVGYASKVTLPAISPIGLAAYHCRDTKPRQAIGVYSKAVKLAKQLNDIWDVAKDIDPIKNSYTFNMLYQAWDEKYYGELLPLLGVDNSCYGDSKDALEDTPDFVVDFVVCPEW